jgi:hypothetical protein
LSSSGGPIETLKRLAWAQDFARRGGSSGGGSNGAVAVAPAVTSRVAGPDTAGAPGAQLAAAAVIATLLDRPGAPTVVGAAPHHEAPPATADSINPPTAAAEHAAATAASRSKRRRRDGSGAWAAVDVEKEELESELRRAELDKAAPREDVSDDGNIDGVPLPASSAADDDDLDGVPLPANHTAPRYVIAANEVNPQTASVSWAQLAASTVLAAGHDASLEENDDDVDGIPL